MRAIDLTGMRFGCLVVQQRHQTRPIMWMCVCDCGKQSSVPTGRLRSGNTRSCGCRKREVLGASTTVHGMHGTRTYRIWKAMLTRCRNPRAKQYKDYGGRGITVCIRWETFANFLADMGEAPLDGSIERIDNEKGYASENCRWATRAEQNRNARSNIRVTIGRETRVVAEWARMHGIRKSVAYARIARGWSLVDACTRPVRPLRRRVPHP